MLKNDQTDREFYNRIKRDFGIHGLLAVKIRDKNGIFTFFIPTALLDNIYILSDSFDRYLYKRRLSCRP